MSSFPDFSFKGNISLFQAVGLAVVGYERKREGEREKKRGGPLVFSLSFFSLEQAKEISTSSLACSCRI